MLIMNFFSMTNIDSNNHHFMVMNSRHNTIVTNTKTPKTLVCTCQGQCMNSWIFCCQNTFFKKINDTFLYVMRKLFEFLFCLCVKDQRPLSVCHQKTQALSLADPEKFPFFLIQDSQYSLRHLLCNLQHLQRIRTKPRRRFLQSTYFFLCKGLQRHFLYPLVNKSEA